MLRANFQKKEVCLQIFIHLLINSQSLKQYGAITYENYLKNERKICFDAKVLVLARKRDKIWAQERG
ncbi:MAG: hypothetical protein DRG50_08330 [Deltaproteobacteria bacterium]|nr:MAG: hypothetical protein DRG50_08330 [Deltaproteobacteria bacterium]